MNRAAAYLKRIDHNRLLTVIALIFHAVGLVGIGFLHSERISRSTPLHLLLMTALLVVSFRPQLRRFAGWALLAAAAGIAAEWMGVHTGYLFGAYRYGSALGPAVDGVPLLIGANWVVIVAGAVSAAQAIARKPSAVVPLAAVIATAMDWLLEPVAIRLGWWSWEGGTVPFFNYVCWAGLSALLAAVWVGVRLRPGGFAVVLLLIQAVFFAALRLLVGGR